MTKIKILAGLAAALLLACTACTQAPAPEKLCEDVLAFYNKPAFAYDFVWTYCSANDGCYTKKGRFYAYRQNDIFYRINVDSSITAEERVANKFDAVHNLMHTGYNEPWDTAYVDGYKDTLDFEGETTFYRDNFIFKPARFKELLTDKRYQRHITTQPDCYEVSIIDTTRDADEISTTTKHVFYYSIAKNDYRVLRSGYTVDFMIDSARFHDSCMTTLSYGKTTPQQITNYVNAFVPYKKLYKEPEMIAQDTVSVFPNFILADAQGKKYDAAKSKARYTLVEFWYRSCAPCLANLRQLKFLGDSVNKDLLEIVAINDGDELNQDLVKFVDGFGIKNYTMLFKGDALRDQLHLIAHPTTYIYDNKDRKVIFYYKGGGPGYASEIKQAVHELATKNSLPVTL